VWSGVSEKLLVIISFPKNKIYYNNYTTLGSSLKPFKAQRITGTTDEKRNMLDSDRITSP